jgi:FkbM family methyltransferase
MENNNISLSFAESSFIKRVKPFIIKVLDYIRFKRSYSQDGEDMVIASFYEGKKDYRGFYVDIGACHPVRFSNTLYFYKNGWRGINIDPTPGSMKPFRLFRSRDINIEMGVGGASGDLNFYCFNQPELNTFSEELAKKRNNRSPYYITKTIKIPVLPLSELLEKHMPAGQKIDFLSIDVEGLDLLVLKSNNWEKYSPDFVLVEDLNFAGASLSIEHSEVARFLFDKGYAQAAILKRTLIFKKI